MTASHCYVATVRDRYGERDEHLDVLAPESFAGWVDAVMSGLVARLGRSAHLVDIVIDVDRRMVLGVPCPVEDAVRELATYLRRLDAGGVALPEKPKSEPDDIRCECRGGCQCPCRVEPQPAVYVIERALREMRICESCNRPEDVFIGTLAEDGTVVP